MINIILDANDQVLGLDRTGTNERPYDLQIFFGQSADLQRTVLQRTLFNFTKYLKLVVSLNSSVSMTFRLQLLSIISSVQAGHILPLLVGVQSCTRGVQSCTAIHRVPRRRIGERPLDIEVSCEISGFRPDE